MNQQTQFIELLKKIGIPTVLVEVGARDGEETKVFSKELPFTKIYSYECNPKTLAICKKACKGLSNVTFRPKAVSCIQGKRKFGILKGDNGSSSFLDHFTEQQEFVEVDCVTLRSDIKEPIEAMWLDTQGSEIDILCSANLSSLKAVHTEVYFQRAYQDQPTYWDIRDFLNSKGLYLHTFTSYMPSFGDAIFIRGHRPVKQFIVEAMFFIKSKIKGLLRKLFS